MAIPDSRRPKPRIDARSRRLHATRRLRRRRRDGGKPARTTAAFHRRQRRPEPADGLVRRGDLKPARAPRTDARLCGRTWLSPRDGLAAWRLEHGARSEAGPEGEIG